MPRTQWRASSLLRMLPLLFLVLGASAFAPAATGPAGFTPCANEAGTYTLNQVSDVAYGANGSFSYKYGVSGPITFNNANFGDPAPNVAKAGYYKPTSGAGPAGYTWCATEGGTYSFGQTADAAYGANGSFNYKYGVTGSLTFNNATFGDPIYGVAKAGYYKVSSGAGPAGYTWCANEGGSYSFSQDADVAYGASGSFAYKYGVTGSTTFDNATFGDPIYGVAKAGYYKLSNGGDWSAQWIWQGADGPSNTWLCLRKKVTLSQKPTSAPTRIAVENKYWLYVNGQLVIPDGGLDIRPDLRNTYFDQVDLAPYLVAGENTLAILAWYKGGTNGYSEVMTGSGGALFQADLSGATPSIIVSDATWRVLVHPSFAKTAQQTQFVGGSHDVKWVEYPVIFDARQAPDWTSAAFNDSSWPLATQKGLPPSAPWNAMQSRTIPMLKIGALTAYTNQSSLPASISKDTTFIADVGNNIQGSAYLKVNAPAGVAISIRMNEFYTEKYITKAGIQEYVTYQWQNPSGRPWSKHCVEYAFTGVSGPVQILDLKFRPSGYNTAFVGSFSCSNPRLNTLWNKCRNTSYVCMRDQFYDCPDRERGQWWGDVSEQILYSFYLYDAKASLLAKKGLRELFNTQKADGSLYTTAPGTNFHLPDQNLAAAASFGDYVLYTGDTDLAKELYPKLWAYIRNYVANTRNGDGMVILQNGPWNWIDWGNNLDIQNGSANTVVNGLFIRLMEAAKLLAQSSGNPQDVSYYQGLEDSVKSHFSQYFWNAGSSAYVAHNLGGVQSGTIDDRSNAWAVLAGAVDASRQAGVLRVLNTQQNASPYQERYIEDGLFAMGKDIDAINRMLSYYQPDIDSWAQTMWERMGDASTDNHAWAAGSCYLLGAYVAGVRPTAPGFSAYQVQPMLGSLTSVSSSVPSPLGTITVNHSLAGNVFTTTLTSPVGSQALVGIPRKLNWTTITVNGSTVWSQGAFVSGVAGISGAGSDSQFIKFSAAPGTWQFQAR